MTKSIENNIATLTFSVIDTGIGIDPQHRAGLFERFNQVNVGTPNAQPGAGLGLSICKHLIDLMGGEITITSILKEGSTVSFNLPFGINHLPPDTQELKLTNFGHKLNVLVAEDNQTNRIVIGGFLNRISARYTFAYDGQQAVNLICCPDHPFDVILMDCDMPELDGCEATKQIRLWESTHQRRPIHIVALSAHVLKEQYDACFKAGMNDYLAKPVKLATLSNALSGILSEKSDIQADINAS